jgi:hypothetical protein
MTTAEEDAERFGVEDSRRLVVPELALRYQTMENQLAAVCKKRRVVGRGPQRVEHLHGGDVS